MLRTGGRLMHLAAMVVVGGEYARDDSGWDVGGEERERG